MTRIFSLAAFALGALIILWMGGNFVGSSLLALVVTALIALAYLVGFVELWRYQQATLALTEALDDARHRGMNSPDDLEEWLAKLPDGLVNGVRQRIRGEYVGLPAPVLTPYLVGLLVMLGLLGTFIGMVDTLKGAVMALEGSTELEAIRAGLAAPMRGLGMAFGTSVAGVTASAMLGFVSTLSRRERVAASRLLDSQRDTGFKQFSLAYNRQQTYAAMQQQAQALPDVAGQLSDLASRLADMGETLSERLLSSQQDFHKELHSAYQQLASSVDSSLKASLAESGRQAGETIKPVVEQLLSGIENDLQQRHQQLNDAASAQLDEAAKHYTQVSKQVAQSWQQGVSAQQQSNQQLLSQVGDALTAHAQQFAQSSENLLSQWQQNSATEQRIQQQAEGERLAQWQQAFSEAQSLLSDKAQALAKDAETRAEAMQEAVDTLLGNAAAQWAERQDAEAQWQEEARARSEALAAQLAEQLQNLRNDEAARGEAALQRLEALQGAAAEHLAALGQALEAPLGRLIESASETPRIAAELMEKLRAEMSKNIERDNSLLDERRELMSELASLTSSLQQSTHGQREAVEQLVSAASERMDKVAQSVASSIDARAEKLVELVDHLDGSAVELAGLGEAFGEAVQQFGDSSGELQGALSGISQALVENTQRSDEQMAYYVAQAREVIDHNLLTQQDILSRLQALSDKAEQLELDMSEDAPA